MFQEYCYDFAEVNFTAQNLHTSKCFRHTFDHGTY